MTDFIFSLAAPHYHKGGWPGVIPVQRNKKPYVDGHHGHDGADATWEEVKELCLQFGTANVALRFPEGMIGIDKDGYDGKNGLKTIAELEERLGPLPPTYMSTNRDDGSGILFYRVPAGLDWPPNLGEDSGVDILWRGNRFAVVAPSVHKEGRRYYWVAPDGRVMTDEAPGPEDITAELPQAWQAWIGELTDGRKYTPRAGGRDVDITEATDWLEEHGGLDEPCVVMKRTVEYWLPRIAASTKGTRHDTALMAIKAVVGDAGQGHLGALAMLREQLWPAWVEVAGKERDHEFKEAIAGAVGMQPEEPDIDPCEEFAALPDGKAKAAKAKPNPKESTATILAKLAMDRYDLGHTDLGEAFGIPKTGARIVQMVRGGQASLGAQLAREFFQLTRKAASKSAVADALLVLEGEAQQRPKTVLALRVGQADGASWLDLGDETGRAVRVGPDGWSVEDSAPILFRRTELTAPLPEPTRGGSVDELWNWIRVQRRDRPLVLAWLVSQLLPEIAHPVPFFTGEQGTGKSFAGRVLRSLLDPSHVPLRKAPRDAESWVTTAAGGWVVALDNLSTIPEWLSDAICRAVTGEGDVRRKLYTDGELALYRFRRCVLINGIEVGATRGDLEDRLLPIGLRPIPESARLEESALLPAWAKAHPAMLGAVLDLSVRVLAEMPRVLLNGRPRMADFARVLAALDVVTGGRGMEQYATAQTRQAVESVMGDPVADAVRFALKDKELVITSADLHRLLVPPDYPAPLGWPKTSRDLGAWLRRKAPVLRKAGWVVQDDGARNKDGVTRWRIRAESA